MILVFYEKPIRFLANDLILENAGINFMIWVDYRKGIWLLNRCKKIVCIHFCRSIYIWCIIYVIQLMVVAVDVKYVIINIKFYLEILLFNQHIHLVLYQN